jgi:hypothetical protein
MTLILVIMLLTGDTMSREVPADRCAALAMRMVQEPGITSAACWTSTRSMVPVFSTVAL